MAGLALAAVNGVTGVSAEDVEVDANSMQKVNFSTAVDGSSKFENYTLNVSSAEDEGSDVSLSSANVTLDGADSGQVSVESVTDNSDSDPHKIEINISDDTQEGTSHSFNIVANLSHNTSSISSESSGKEYRLKGSNTVSGTINYDFVDTISPTLSTVSTKDNGPVSNPISGSETNTSEAENGEIDTIVLTFSEDIDDSTVNESRFSITDGYSIDYIGTGAQSNDSTIKIDLVESGSSDTGATPTVEYTSGTLADSAGNMVSDFSNQSADGAAPQPKVAFKVNESGTDADKLYVNFTEEISDANTNLSDSSNLTLENGQVDSFDITPDDNQIEIGISGVGKPSAVSNLKAAGDNGGAVSIGDADGAKTSYKEGELVTATNGSDVNTCIDLVQPRAFDLVTDIKNSSFSHCIGINESGVTLNGQNYTLNGNGGVSEGLVRVDGAGEVSDVKVSNITVMNAEENQGGPAAGIFVENATNFTVEHVNATANFYGIRIVEGPDSNIADNDVAKNTRDGISVESSEGSSVTGNKVTGNNEVGNPGFAGIYLNGSDGAEVKDNNLSSNEGLGIYFRKIEDAVVHGNSVSQTSGASSIGIKVGSVPYASLNNTVSENTVFKNTDGITVYANESQLEYNNVSNNNNEGITLFGEKVKVSRNHIEDSGTAGSGAGLLVYNANRSEVIHNTILDSRSHGINLLSDASHSFFKNNTVEESGSNGLNTGDTGIKKNNTFNDTEFLNSGLNAIKLAEGTNSEHVENEFNQVSMLNSSNSFILNEVDAVSNTFDNIELFKDFDFTVRGKNYRINDSSASNAKALPSGEFSLGQEYFNITNMSETGESAWVQLNVTYSDSMVDGLNESSIRILHYNSGSWQEVTAAGVDTSENLVYGNVTSFSRFKIAGEGEPDISVEPSDYEFGTEDTDSSDTKMFTITNNGRTDLRLTDTTITGDDDQFSITSGDVSSDTNVTPSGSYSIEVEFAPNSADTFDADLEIDSNDPQGTEVIALDGEGTSPDEEGGGGGGGAVTDTPTNTVSKNVGSLAAGASASLEVDDGERFGPEKVQVTVSNSVSNLDMQVNAQKGAPNGISTPERSAYRYMDISVGASDEDIEEGAIEFKVNKSWIDDNGYDSDTVQLERYYDSEWSALETSLQDESESKYDFEAKTPGFSFFAVTAEEGMEETGADDTDTDAEDTNQTESQNSTEEGTEDINQTDDQTEAQKTSKVPPILAPVLVVFLVIVAAGAAYLKREELEEMIEDLRDGEDEEEEESLENTEFEFE